MACLPTSPVALALRRRLGLWLFVLLCLGLGYAQEKKAVKSKVGDKVSLPCCRDIYSLKSLTDHRVYWQKNTTEVVLAYAEGIKISKNEWYDNRTDMDTGNLTLWISPVKILDNGSYQCVVQRLSSKNPAVICDETVTLFVTADFSKPNVTAEVYTSSCESAEMLVRCSSHGGFPKPTISGALNNESAVWNDSQVFESSLSLYNVTAKLWVSVTKDINFTCSVEYSGFTKSTTLLLDVGPLPFWYDGNGPPNKSFMNTEFQTGSSQALQEWSGRLYSGSEKTCVVPTVPPTYTAITVSSIIIISLLVVILAARYLSRHVCSHCCKPQDSAEEAVKEYTKLAMSSGVTSETSSV